MISIKRMMFALLAMLLVTLPQWSFSVTAAPTTQQPSCLFLTEAVSGEGGFSVCDDASARFRTAFEQWGLQKIGYPISQRYTRDGFVTQAFQKAIMQWREETNSVVLVNIFDDLHNDGFDETLLTVRQTPSQLPPGWDGDISFDEVVNKRQALLNKRPALREAYFEVGDPLTFYGLPTSEAEDMENHVAIRLQRAVLQEWKEDVPWASAGEVTIANGGDIAKELGGLPELALKPETEPPNATSTITPIPTMTPEEVEEAPEPIALPTTCGDLNTPARLVVYGYTTNPFRRDPAPDGNDDYNGNLLLDDSIPDQNTNDSLAHDTYDLARKVDDYFQKLRLEGFGIWDGCYGLAATERIMTSRIHYQGIRAKFVGESYAESLFDDDFITPEIVAHEWTHGVVGRAVNIWATDGYGPLPGQSGALFESIPDVFAMLITGDYELHSKLGLERSLKDPTNPENFDQQANHWLDYDDHDNPQKCHLREDTGECRVKYYQAGIPSYAAYLMMEGGRHPAERREKDDVIYEPITVTGIGRDKVARIYFHALNRDYILEPEYREEGGPANFETFANGVINACLNLKDNNEQGGIKQADCDQVRNAFYAVGMLRPEPESSEGLIAFASSRDHLGKGSQSDPLELYVMKPDGSEETRITLGEGWAADLGLLNLQWLPNGREIALQPSGVGGSTVDGEFRVRAWVHIVDRLSGSQRDINLANGNQAGVYPRWSPSGNRIVLASFRTSPSGAAIYTTDTNGQNWRQLTDPPEGSFGDGWPSWSPNGNQIAFSRFVRGSEGLFIIDSNGGEPQQVFSGFSRWTDWSPDGDKLVFEGSSHQEMDIWVVGVNGDQPTNLTNTPDVRESNPSWSRDGTSIVYQVDDGDNAQIWSMDADGSNKQQLTSTGANGWPDWSP